MSIMIKGMDMPDKCGHCRFATAFDCGVDGQFIKTHDVRRKDCPLIEVPEPHGRLIDADAVTLEGGPYEYDDWCKWALDRYLDAPTVIPADESDIA